MTILLSVAGLIYTLIIAIVFFKKDNIASDEIKIYKLLITMTIVSLLAELFIPVANYFNLAIKDFSLKFYLICILSWTAVFFLYVFSISHKELLIKEKKIIFPIYTFINIIISIMILVLPVHFYKNGNIAYSYGASVDFLVLITSIYVIAISLTMVADFKHIMSKKYISVISLVMLLVITAMIQRTNPEILIINFIYSITILIMYFTIENPDVKMLEELYKNKKLIESNNEDTSNFIFKITQDIKKPVDDIIRISSNSNDEKLKEINNISKNLNYLIDDALDISTMTNDNLKTYNTKYNPTNLFKSLKEKYENKLTENVKLDFTISETIPNYVYGDSIKLKQIIGSILQNSIDHTAVGVITFEIDTIIKYGICRFIINITDNGEGISIDKVNEILSLKELDYEIDLNKEILNLREAKILLNKIGGAFMIKSDDNKTNVSIIVNQKIVETNENKKDKELNLYQQKIIKSKKIMIVDDDSKELKLIKERLENNNIDVSSSLYGKDVIEKIKNNYKFDLILLDDETNTDSAYEVLKELKKDKEFKAKVVIMINDEKKFIKKHYLEDGFIDIILKSDLKNELDRVLKKQL